MQTKYILSIDQGTTSSRAILFDVTGNIIAMHQEEITQIKRASGFVEHDANEIYTSVLSCIDKAIENANIKVSEIDSIGITNQRETSVLFHKETGLPVCNAICWQSTQSDYICKELLEKGYEDLIFDKTGLWIDSYFSASKIKYMLDHYPDVYEMYLKNEILFGTIDSYLLYRLTDGKSFFTDVTNASRTMLFNINTLEYDDELLEIFNIKKSILPTVLETSANFGCVKIHGHLIMVASMVGDQQASLFGHCAFEKGDIKNTYGTGCFMLLNTEDKIVKSKTGLLTTIAYKINGKVTYALEGSIFVAGAAVTWLKDQMEFIKKSSDSEEIARHCDDEDLVIVPSFVGMGTPYWDSDVRGAMFGISLNTSKNCIVKAVLKAIAFQSKDIFEIMRKEAKIEVLSISVDGGASNNNFLMQFQADIMNCNIRKPRHFETTALGACFLAGLYTGFFKGLNSLKEINQTKERITPSMEQAEVNKVYAKWQKAVKVTLLYK